MRSSKEFSIHISTRKRKRKFSMKYLFSYLPSNIREAGLA
jgi:hypothetical protein